MRLQERLKGGRKTEEARRSEHAPDTLADALSALGLVQSIQYFVRLSNPPHPLEYEVDRRIMLLI
jgi:hypothetical protein